MLHTADLAFWFYSLGNVPYQIAGDEVNAYKVADTMSSALAAFCRNGDPSTPNLKWLPHEEGNAHVMVLDVESTLRDGGYDTELLEHLK